MSRDVVFYEHIFPYQRIEDTSNETDSPDIHDQNLFAKDQPILNQPSQVIFTPVIILKIMLMMTMNQTFSSLKKFVPIETKILMRIMKQHSPFE